MPATKVWLGGSTPIVNKWTITLTGTWDDASIKIITVTIDGASLILSVTPITLATKADIVDGLVAMCSGGTVTSTATVTLSANGSGSKVGQFASCTFTDGGDFMTITGPADAMPIAVSVSDTSTNGIATAAEVQAESGPSHFDVAANWLTAVVPVAGDSLIFDHRAVAPLKYAIDRSFDSFVLIDVTEGYRFSIGLPATNNTAPAAPYAETRGRYLQAHGTTINIRGGVGVMNINTGTATATTITIDRPAQLTAVGLPSINILGTKTTTEWVFARGDAGFAMEGETTAGCNNLRIGSVGQGLNETVAFIGRGVTVTGDLIVQAGTVYNSANIVDLWQSGGLVRHLEGTMTNAYLDKGTLEYRSPGTLTFGRVGDGGVLDCEKNGSTRTFTNITLGKGYSFLDRQGTVTHTNPTQFYNTSPDEGTLRIKKHRKLTWVDI